MTMIFNPSTDRPTLIYIGDPMCSWCYGILQELAEAKSELGDKVEFEIVVGGLRAGGEEDWTSEFTGFLKHHWEEVSARSGQEFSYDILATETFDYDTEPSCRAVVVSQSIAIDKSFEFFKAVQRKFYFDNQDPKKVSFYKSICEQFDIDYDTFATRFEIDAYKIATADHFDRARKLGVNSFPTLILKIGDKYQLVGRGYVEKEQIMNNIELLLKNNG